MSRKSVLYAGLAVLIVASMLLGGCTSTAQNPATKKVATLIFTQEPEILEHDVHKYVFLPNPAAGF